MPIHTKWSRSKIISLIFALVFITFGLERLAQAASPGDLDLTFGFGDFGVNYTDIGTGTNDAAYAVIALDGGGILVGGSSEDDFALVKYTADGNVDTTFGSNGRVTTNISGTNIDQINALAVDSNNNIIAVGTTNNGVNDAIAVVRYDSTGALDASFDGDGILSTSLGGTNAAATAVALESDDDIVIGGTLDDDFVVLRLQSSNGALDTNFDSDGFNIVDISGNTDTGEGLVIQASGSIVIGGTANMGDDQDFALARFTSTGQLDTSTFGTLGKATADPSNGSNDIAYALGEQATGALIIAGYTEGITDEDAALARFTSDGQLDINFGTNGSVVTVNTGGDFVYDLAVQATDKLIVIGFTNQGPGTNEDFRLVRYDSDGALDTNFGTGGTVYTDFGTVLTNGNNQDEAYAVALQADGKVIVVGITDVTSGDKNFAIARYESQNNAPTLDNSNKNGDEDSTLTFTSADFSDNFTDQDSDNLMHVRIETLPANGTLALDGTAVAQNDEIALADLGTLTFEPDTDWNGDTSFTWNGFDGIDYAATAATLTITIDPVNDMPSFTPGDAQSILEDAGTQTVPGWAKAMSAGPDNESGQVITFTVSTDNSTLLPTPPAIDATSGELSYTPASNIFGSATITVTLQDDGGIGNGGTNTSAESVFTITVNPVNDAPTFSSTGQATADEDDGAQKFAGWASGISPGPFGEDGQQLSFSVASNNNAAFTTPPDIDEISGDLTFTTAPNVNGSITLTITLRDNGGTANSGSNTVTKSAQITINPVNDAPTVTGFALVGAENAALEFATADFSDNFADIDGDTLASIQIVSLPENGTLLLNNTAVTLNQIIPSTQISQLTFQPDLHWFGNTQFTWNGSDGEALAVHSATVAITIENRYFNYLPIVVSNGT